MKAEAIDKIREEIKEKQKMLDSLMNFEYLNLYEQLHVIQNTQLRYDREFRETWFTDRFNIKPDKITSDQNTIHLFLGNYDIYVNMYVSKVICIREIQGQKMDNRYSYNVKREEKAIAELPVLNAFIEKPSYKNYLKTLKNKSFYNKMFYWMHNHEAIRLTAMFRNNCERIISECGSIKIEDAKNKHWNEVELPALRKEIKEILHDDLEKFKLDKVKVIFTFE